MKKLALLLAATAVLALSSCKQLGSIIPDFPPVSGTVETPPYCVTVYDRNGTKVEVCGYGRLTSDSTTEVTGQK